MEKVRVGENYIIKLPESIRAFIKTNDEFIINRFNDTIELKKIRKMDLLEKATRIKDKDRPSTVELNSIIHKLRKKK